MTDPQAVAFEALSRGRLVFPYREEMEDLRDERDARAKDAELHDLEGLEMVLCIELETGNRNRAGDVDLDRRGAEALACVTSSDRHNGLRTARARDGDTRVLHQNLRVDSYVRLRIELSRHRSPATPAMRSAK